MSVWSLLYEGFDPRLEGKRETLCTLGNGYFAARGAAPDAVADGVHYPGTYLAGGYDRLTTLVGDRAVENEDLVNIPNWLPLSFRVGDGPWLAPDRVEYLDYRQELHLDCGLLCRSIRFRDAEGRTTRWEERRIVSMDAAHIAALEVALTPEDWSGRITVRTAIDGSVINAGVPRYRDLSSRHLETLGVEQPREDTILLRSRFVQTRRDVAVAARTRIAGGAAPVRRTRREPDVVSQEVDLDIVHGAPITVEKVAAVFASTDVAISEAGLAAVDELDHAGTFDELLHDHRRVWLHLWDICDIRIQMTEPDETQMKLRLHIFHLLQTVSVHSIDLDVGLPPRGWHGEAYRGHIMWDELFIFPYLNLRRAVLTRALLRYRYRRLEAARRAAAEEGCRGAMFPWQSGSSGREESQRLHLNPMSGRWVADNSYRQRHVGAAIALNVWQYYQVTDDREFLSDYGAELMLEIARFWASIAVRNEDSGCYEIHGVMGPDEFHTAYPDVDPAEAGGLRNNAYTNVLVSWVLTRALDVLEILPEDRRRTIRDQLRLGDEELGRWGEISRGLVVPFHDDDIISQFEGYERLEPFDWDGYRERYGGVERLDRILENEGDDPNRYQISKQADVLMLFYLFSTEELTDIFDRLGYAFAPGMIFRNIQYYLQRTSHGSTLSFVTHAWVLARAYRARSWPLLLKALDADYADMQGGTTREGIHLGAMASTVDIVQRAYVGIETRANLLAFNPQLPDELTRLETSIHYRGHTLDLVVTHEELQVASRPSQAAPVTVAYRGHIRQVSPGQRYDFHLIRRREREDWEKRQAQRELKRCREGQPAREEAAVEPA